jgi:hypothetical protein
MWSIDHIYKFVSDVSLIKLLEYLLKSIGPPYFLSDLVKTIAGVFILRLSCESSSAIGRNITNRILHVFYHNGIVDAHIGVA